MISHVATGLPGMSDSVRQVPGEERRSGKRSDPMCVSLSLSLSLYIYIYTYVYTLYMYIYMYIYIYIYIYTYVYAHMNMYIAQRPEPSKSSSLRRRCCKCRVEPRVVQYTRSPLEDSRLFGPSPWKILAATYEKDTSEQPSPWRKSCKRESCYGDRVWCNTNRMALPAMNPSSF